MLPMQVLNQTTVILGTVYSAWVLYHWQHCNTPVQQDITHTMSSVCLCLRILNTWIQHNAQFQNFGKDNSNKMCNVLLWNENGKTDAQKLGLKTNFYNSN